MSQNQQLICLPISYFGPIAYYSTILHYPCQIEYHENYQKRSIRNRAQILSSNGPINISVPLKKGKTNLSITAVQIAYDEPWYDNHLKSIISAYGTAPYFDFYIDKIKDLLESKPQLLFDLNVNIREFVFKIIGLDSISNTSEYNKSDRVYRPTFTNKNKKQEIVIQEYTQVFTEKYGFTPNLSVLDLIFNVGPESNRILQASKVIFH